VRTYYQNRLDRLRLRIKYPYEYKLVEYFDPDEKYNYWKKMVLVEGQERVIYFYHHRNNEKNKDGLIF